MTAQGRWLLLAIICAAMYCAFGHLSYLVIACMAIICSEVRASR